MDKIELTPQIYAVISGDKVAFVKSNDEPHPIQWLTKEQLLKIADEFKK